MSLKKLPLDKYPKLTITVPPHILQSAKRVRAEDKIPISEQFVKGFILMRRGKR